jgi:hypothetical protein
MLMPFGKHKGAELDTIPAGYLTWLITTELRDLLRDAVVAELARRKSSTSTTTATANHATRGPARRRPTRRPSRERPSRCLHDAVPF